ncbi:hypothetical protein ACFX2I_023813 [Malus domestica]
MELLAQQTREWKVTHKETLGPISELTGAAITIRGQYFPPCKVPGPEHCKVFLFIEGPTEQSVKRGTLCAYACMLNISFALTKLCKRCDHGVILQFKGMFCLGIAGADQLPSKMDLLLWRCSL